MKKTIPLVNLLPGQEVATANDRLTSRVIRRTGKNLYLVAYRDTGKEVEMRRSMLGVKVHSSFRFGAVNTTEAVSA